MTEEQLKEIEERAKSLVVIEIKLPILKKIDTLVLENIPELVAEVRLLREALLQCLGSIERALSTVDTPAAREHIRIEFENVVEKASAALGEKK